MPVEFASSHNREFVRPDGLLGRVARMSLDEKGVIRLLVPDEESIELNAKQPGGFPASPTACTQ